MVSALLVLATGVTALVLGPVSAQAAPASPGLPDVTIQATTTPLSNNANSGTATTVTASCPSGSTLVGGGGFLRRISSATDAPGNGLKLNGTLPSDATGNSASPTTSTPVNWAAVAGFGGQSDIGDQASAFADCVRGPTTTRVVVSTPVGVATQGNAPLKTTATCPSGTRLLSGGALGVPPSQPSFKPIASYPSDVAGNPVATAALNPMSWSAYGSAGVSAADEQVTAYALCATDATVNVQVTRVDAPGPQTGSTFTTTTATCATGRLLGGGVLADQGLNVQPQQGVHLRGSYPSDTTGAAVPNQASNPTSWSGAIQAGGQDTPGTQGHVFAMCAIPTSTPTPSPTPVVSPTPMVTPTPEPPPVMTPTPVVSPTPVVTPTPTSTPSPSPGPGATVTATTLIVIQLRLLGLDGLVIPIGYVMPVNAAGTVQFKDGATDLGRPVPVVAGIALGPVSILNAGQHSLSAIFTPSNPTRFQPSVSNTVTLRFLAAQW